MRPNHRSLAAAKCCARTRRVCAAGRRMNVRLALLGVLMSIVAGCGGSGPSAPTPIQTSAPSSPAGNWSGTLKDPVAGEGTMQMSLADQSGVLKGTWSATLESGAKASGASVATLAQGGYSIILYPDPTACATTNEPGLLLLYTLSNVAVTSQRLTAVLMRFSCSGPVFAFGSVDLSKQ
jgi:hypothetical protein